MPATSSKAPTYRLFKVASELNLGKETIVELLRTKGFEISDKPTTQLSQEMYDVVMDKFQREHKLVEKQRAKVGAYHTSVTKRTTRPGQEEPEEESPAPHQTTSTAPPEPEVSAEQTPAPVEVEMPATPVEVAAPIEAGAVPEAPSESVENPAPEPAAETPAPTTIDTVSQLRRSLTAEELEIARRDNEQRLRDVVRQARGEEETPAEAAAPPPAPEPVPEVPAAPPVSEKIVIDPPKLQGLTVLGKIAVGGDKTARRTRTRGTKINIDAETKKQGDGTARPAGATGGTARGGVAPGAGGGTGAGTAGAAKKGPQRGGKRGIIVDQASVQRAMRDTRARMADSAGGGFGQKSRKGKRDKHAEKRQQEIEQEQADSTVLRVAEFATVAELASLMRVDVGQVIAKCIGLGLMVSINQRLEKDTIQLVADEFGYTVEFMEDVAEDLLADVEDAPETLQMRAPIVTIMGHVDHGKTSLLDYIRSANVVAGESGGITQHIGAYAVTLPDGRKITFLDTPGHEAFTAMRARGAQITDIVVLTVSADDAVMPQTIEAISHAQAASVPMIIAINKIDKPDANPERIKQQLADRGILVEEWGGKYQCVELSAKTGLNVDKLLDGILLEAEILDLKANPDRKARGVIIEAEIDKGKGVVATVLVQKGTLQIGDPLIAGQYAGRVRALLDERGHRLKSVGPSEPAQVLGLDGVPTAGDVLAAMETEQETREIAQRRQQMRREQESKMGGRHLSLDDLSEQIAKGGVQQLPLIIKGDVDGSVEALADSLLRLSTSEVQVSVVLKSVGEITESDVQLAMASNAVMIGFHVRPNLKARKLAEREGVEIRTYQIIYDAVNDMKLALEGMLKPEEKEVITGTVEIRDVFKISRLGTIAGCYVQDGKITRNDKVRLLRDGLVIWNGSIASLRRHKDDVREVEQGFECGISLEGMNDVKVSDIIESYAMVEVKRKLETAA